MFRGSRICLFILLSVILGECAAHAGPVGFVWHDLKVKKPGREELSPSVALLDVVIHAEFPASLDAEEISVTLDQSGMADCSRNPQALSFQACPSGRFVHRKTLWCKKPATGALSTCEVTEPFRADELRKGLLLRYFATAFRSEGEPKNTVTDKVLCGLGEPPKTGRMKVAIPLWVHWDENIAAKKNIAFLPSPEYRLQGRAKGYWEFMQDTLNLATPVFFRSDSGTYSQVFYRNRERVNLWIAGYGADRPTPSQLNLLCGFSLSADLNVLVAAMDSLVLVHRWDQAKDCSRIELADGYHQAFKGTVHANRGPLPSWVFVHEAGHFLFGQSDEYCCDGGYRTRVRCSNVFKDSNCNGVTPGSCEEIEFAPRSRVYRLVDRQNGRREIPEVRRLDGDLAGTDWGISSLPAIERVFPTFPCRPTTGCDCPPQDVPPPTGSGSVVDGFILKVKAPGTRESTAAEAPPPDYSSCSEIGFELVPVRKPGAEAGDRWKAYRVKIVERPFLSPVDIVPHVYAQEGGSVFEPETGVTTIELPISLATNSAVAIQVYPDGERKGKPCRITVGDLLARQR